MDSAHGVSAPKPPRILVTEDEYIVALDLKVRLQNLGCEVVGVAGSGDDAILQVEAEHPDIILMDIMLDGEMDGIETAEHILQNHDLPIIFLTANADLTTLERANAIRPYSYLLKPFRERELKFTIDMALHHHRTSQELKETKAELERRVAARTEELVKANEHLHRELESHQKTLADLREAQRVAKCADHAKNEFLATISHELLTPMNGILGMVDVMSAGATSEAQREQLDIVQASGESLLNIINDMLDFSRVESGTIPYAPTPFSLRAQLTACLAPLACRAQEKNLLLSWSVGENVPDNLTADATRIGQILINLVSNAVKFTERGEVEITVMKQAETRDRIQLQFVIRDTGIGIPVEKQKFIFEPFVQVDSSPTRRHGGVGLGLSISAKLVELMGSKIEVESTANVGSTFRFSLWLDAADRETDPTKSISTCPSAS
ncbi:MAG: ATP-binding protein [Nibricoccus sp.]